MTDAVQHLLFNIPPALLEWLVGALTADVDYCNAADRTVSKWPLPRIYRKRAELAKVNSNRNLPEYWNNCGSLHHLPAFIDDEKVSRMAATTVTIPISQSYFSKFRTTDAIPAGTTLTMELIIGLMYHRDNETSGISTLLISLLLL
jgi:hypothetical protein